MNFEAYLDSLRGRSAAVIGIGVSNKPLIRLLLDRGSPSPAGTKRRTWETWGRSWPPTAAG